MRKYISKNWFELLIIVVNIYCAIATENILEMVIHTIGASMLAGLKIGQFLYKK